MGQMFFVKCQKMSQENQLKLEFPLKFPCLKCGKVLDSEFNREKHLLTCNKKIIYSVSQPGQSNFSGLKYSITQAGKNDYSCLKCDIKFCSKESLDLHMTNCESSKFNGKKENGATQFDCDLVYEQKANPNQPSKQIFVVKPREIPKSVEVSNSQLDPIESKNPNPDPFKRFSCGKCGKFYSSKQFMRMHFEMCNGFGSILPNIGTNSTASMKTIPTNSGHIGKQKPNILSGPKPEKQYLCSKCCVLFYSKESLEVHFKSCKIPKTLSEPVKEKPPIQVTNQNRAAAASPEAKNYVVQRFACSKCKLPFLTEDQMELHFQNCQIDRQPGEIHFDHTYSKVILTPQNVKRNLFGEESLKQKCQTITGTKLFTNTTFKSR